MPTLFPLGPFDAFLYPQSFASGISLCIDSQAVRHPTRITASSGGETTPTGQDLHNARPDSMSSTSGSLPQPRLCTIAGLEG